MQNYYGKYLKKLRKGNFLEGEDKKYKNIYKIYCSKYIYICVCVYYVFLFIKNKTDKYKYLFIIF